MSYAYKISIGNPEGKKPLLRPDSNREDNTKKIIT
jgi:hypothetical protein